ncbi:hypothetical protein CRENBAI_012652 [Crenichthys baileyi]|uniref:Uncharacterized protein n=1 Tax=Crenichthys baileyi TaxID=28760 RepID=A0AAV9SD07_9TELE
MSYIFTRLHKFLLFITNKHLETALVVFVIGSVVESKNKHIRSMKCTVSNFQTFCAVQMYWDTGAAFIGCYFLTTGYFCSDFTISCLKDYLNMGVVNHSD